MHQTIYIALHEQGVVFKHGLPKSVLGPGRHGVWGFGIGVGIYDTRDLLIDAPAEVRALLGQGNLAEARIAPNQRGVLAVNSQPKVFLRPGVHRYWTIDPSVELHVYDVELPVPDLTKELLALIPRDELVAVTVFEYQRGLLYVRGRFERVLHAGRYAYWTQPSKPVSIQLIDMRRKQLAVGGQELLTNDKVTLRLSLTVDFAPADPETASHTIANHETALYSLVQLAVREFVAGVTLDELLEGRDALATFLAERAGEEALRFGIRVVAIGVKDIVLPGDMKALLNRVIEAEKQSLANVITRRDDAQATRTLANAAKVMQANPVLLRLKELEALERIATKVTEVKLSLGREGLDSLLPMLTAE